MQEWGFQNEETKRILAMRYQKKQKQKRQKELSAEEKFKRFKLNEEINKRRGPVAQLPPKPQRMSYF